MKCFRVVLLTSLIGLSSGLVFAQVGPGAGHGPMDAGPAASAPGMGMGMGMGGGHGGARWGSDFTPGWAMMDPQERKDHQEHMRAMTGHDECKAYQDQHHEQMAARASQRGGKALAQPRRDACGGLKK